MPVKVPKEAKLGLLPVFEWPIMAFMGVILGMLAKVAATKGMFDGITDAASMDSEMGLPVIGYRVTSWINGINAFILFFVYFLPPIVV
jgi:hypothetical protein